MVIKPLQSNWKRTQEKWRSFYDHFMIIDDSSNIINWSALLIMILDHQMSSSWWLSRSSNGDLSWAIMIDHDKTWLRLSHSAFSLVNDYDQGYIFIIKHDYSWHFMIIRTALLIRSLFLNIWFCLENHHCLSWSVLTDNDDYI